MTQVTVTHDLEVAKVAEFWLRADAGQAFEEAAKEEKAGKRDDALTNLTISEQLTQAANDLQEAIEAVA